MKTLKNNRKLYLSPEITSIKLDNEISLALESAPPKGPGESTTFEDLFQSEETGNSPWE